MSDKNKHFKIGGENKTLENNTNMPRFLVLNFLFLVKSSMCERVVYKESSTDDCVGL
jgi:hypothetical protein